MEQKTISLDEVKIAVIKKILDDEAAAGRIQTQEAYDAEYQVLLTKVRSSDLISRPKPQSGITNAESFNNDIGDLYLDVLTAFGSMNRLDEAVTRHQKMNESTVNALRTQVLKIGDAVSNFEQILKTQHGSDHYEEGFRDVGCFEESQLLYAERDGSVLSPSYKANLDRHNEHLTLPYMERTSALIHPNGIPFAEATLPKQLGSGLIRIRNERNLLDKAIDTSTETYWAECLLVDTPMQVELDEYYYRSDFGALCEVEVRFQTPTVINEISLIPYGSYPMEMMAIRFYETDEESEPIKEIVAPSSEDPLLRPGHLERPIGYRFEDRLCKRVRILLNQIHYIKQTVIVDTEEQAKNELWFKATGPIEYDLSGNEIFPPVYQDKAMEDKSWVLFNQSIDVTELDVEKLLDVPSRPQPVSKYEYTYGLYNIGVYRNDFQDVGVFVSPMIQARSNIKSIELDVTQASPNGIPCDIEYYISSVENPSGSDWFSMLPKGQSLVVNELLSTGKSDGMAVFYDLRFPATGDVTIKADGIVVDEAFLSFRQNLLGQKNKVAILPFKKSGVVYTADYTPASGHVVDFVENRSEPPVMTDTIQATGQNFYTLSNVPYIYDGMFMNVQIASKDGLSQFESWGALDNVTNKLSPSESYREFRAGRLQYYVDKNKLYFNEDIEIGKTIVIRYSSFISRVRVKAILRRNCRGNNWASPSLDGLQVTFNLME